MIQFYIWMYNCTFLTAAEATATETEAPASSHEESDLFVSSPGFVPWAEGEGEGEMSQEEPNPPQKDQAVEKGN